MVENYKVFFSHKLFDDGKWQEHAAENLHEAMERVGKLLRGKDIQLDTGYQSIQFCVPNTNEIYARISWEEADTE